jgi:SPFH domain / Band 7 family
MEDFLGSLGFLAMIAVIIGFRLRSSYRRVIVLDYQQGVKFKNGIISEVLAAGIYKIHAKRDRIEIVDMRPQPFLFEAVSCLDALKHAVVISVTAEVVVEDAKKAFANTREQSDDIVARIPQVIREVTARTIVQESSEAEFAQRRQSLIEELQKTFSPMGFAVTNLELTELWAEPTGGKLAAGIA